MNHHRPTSLMVFFLGFAVSIGVSGAEPEAGKSAPPKLTGPVLYLLDGGFVAGNFVDSEKADVLRWQSPAFTAAFEFPIKNVSAIVTPPPAQPIKPLGDFRFELLGGDLVFGSLIALDDHFATLDLPRFGQLKIKREGLIRMDRWSENSDLIYLGPHGLTGWTVPKNEKEDDWRDESGELSTEKEGATIQADLGIPSRAAIDFEISWKKTPDFVFTLGIDPSEKTAQEILSAPIDRLRVRAMDQDARAIAFQKMLQQGFRLEVWENDLVLTKEGEKEADIASVGTVDNKGGRINLRVLLDQEKGTLVAIAPDGKILAQLATSEKIPKSLSGVRLENKRGDVRLERLQITQWNGDPPRSTIADNASLLAIDGTTQPGKIKGYDPESKMFTIVDGTNEKRVARDKVSRIVFATPETEPSRAVRVVYQDGTRISGDLVKIQAGSLWLTNSVVEGTGKVPLEGLRSLSVQRDPDAKSDTVKATPRLELDGLKLLGSLVNGQNNANTSCLTWKPSTSNTAASLRQGQSGKVIYKEVVVTPVTTNTQIVNRNRVVVNQMGIAPARVANAPVALLGGVVRAFGGSMSSNTPATTPANPLKRAIHLITGDIIPAGIEKIDEQGVTIKTTLSKNTLVPNDKVKAVELAPEPSITVRLNKAKRERLLTLPRAQKGSPPTHMIRSTNGDFLRGRLVAMDEKNLQVEMRLENKPVPRDRVSRIIWLHPEEVVGPKAPQAKDLNKDETSRVQAVRSDGFRFTFTPDKVDGVTISGKSDLFGACQVNLTEVDQILIAGAIEKEAAKLLYQQWVLKDALEPKSAREDGEDSPGGRSPGTESPLVGKPAPDFKLDLLDGKPFALGDTKGKVVILDFWATWCGPCIQAMPQVEKVANEFKDRGVQLIAVNLQETPRDIKPMLERHKFNMTVALDRDGVVAERYKANAIPQTVIIDKEGKIARLFVGSSPNLADQLREALKVVLDGPEKKDLENEKEPAK